METINKKPVMDSLESKIQSEQSRKLVLMRLYQCKLKLSVISILMEGTQY